MLNYRHEKYEFVNPKWSPRFLLIATAEKNASPFPFSSSQQHLPYTTAQESWLERAPHGLRYYSAIFYIYCVWKSAAHRSQLRTNFLYALRYLHHYVTSQPERRKCFCLWCTSSYPTRSDTLTFWWGNVRNGRQSCKKILVNFLLLAAPQLHYTEGSHLAEAKVYFFILKLNFRVLLYEPLPNAIFTPNNIRALLYYVVVQIL